MPIGKNAIKRVANNGYSKVETSAPDMENSVVEEVKAPAEEKETSQKKAPVKKAPAKKSATATKATTKKTSAPKKTAEKKAENKPEVKKSMETEPGFSPVKTLEKVTEKSEREGEGYINLGGSLPYYLL